MRTSREPIAQIVLASPRLPRELMITKRRLLLSLAILAFAFPVSGQDVEGGPLVEPFDIDEVRKTWRNLANEQVIFPLDMKDMPVEIGPERQLLLDNYLIAEARHVTRQIHQPKRYRGNPVLAPPRAAVNHAVVQHVLHFEPSPRFRMWYWSYDGWQTLPGGRRIRFASSYATSDDGVHWERPNLDLHNVKGLEGPNNVVIPYGLMQGVFYNADEPDRDKRFKALVLVERENPTVREGYYLHASPDGIHWEGDLSRPVIPSLTGDYGIPQDGVGDTTRFWWDPIRRKYIGDVKFVISPGTLRSRGVMESDDLIHWTRPTPTFFARAPDAQIYGHRGFPYQGMYVGMRWIFLPGHSRRHSSYVELDCSRDGRIWTRVGAGQPFMALNPNHDTWDASIMRPVSMLEVGDEIWIYYFGAPTELESDNANYPKSQPVDWSAGLAKLPRDRFASINASKDTGTLITRPLNFHGSKLHVNAAVAPGGRLRVGIATRDGKPVPSYDTADCLPIDGDGIDLPVAWKGREELAGLDDSQVRLRFQMRDAKLFSFWIE